MEETVNKELFESEEKDEQNSLGSCCCFRRGTSKHLRPFLNADGGNLLRYSLMHKAMERKLSIVCRQGGGKVILIICIQK